MDNIKISVYIPTHNRPKFLERALSSLKKQTYRDFQVVVCDDGSSDENFTLSKNIIQPFRQSFADLIVLRSEHPEGACAARNKAIDACDGEYVTGLDDDDEFTPERLEIFTKTKFLSSYPYLCTGQIVDNGHSKQKSLLYLNKETSLKALSFQNVVGNQIFTSKALIQNVGGFDVNFPAWQDYELWFRITKKYGSGFKIPCHTYLLNVGHELNRITNSNKSKLAIDMFLQKHGMSLSQANVKALQLQDIINRREDISLAQAVKYIDSHTYFTMLKYLVSKNCPHFTKALKKYF